MEANNILELKPQDLLRPMGDLLRNVMQREGRSGWPRLTYCDQYDTIQIVLLNSTHGINVNIRINNQQAYQLNSIFFGYQTPIGLPLLMASGIRPNKEADLGAVIRSFFGVVEG